MSTQQGEGSSYLASALKCLFVGLFAGLIFGSFFFVPQNHVYDSSPPMMLNSSHARIKIHTQVYDSVYFDDLRTRMRTATSVIYNRVPKSGSSATRTVLMALSRQPSKPFIFSSSKLYHTEHLSANDTQKLVAKLRHLSEPTWQRWIFERHLHFFDTRQFDIKLPMYVNIVRDPVERFVSQYYFYRFEHVKPMSDSRRNRTFDECVFQNFNECQTEAAWVIIPFFCGQDQMCLIPCKQALEKAKENVDKYFGAVGITEDLMTSYQLFEKTMPHFFANMSRVATGKLRSLKSKYKTHKKPTPSNEALQIMRSRLTLENEFYAYVKKRYMAFLKYYNITSPVLESSEREMAIT